ncbi:hypothetical protein KDL01_31120 [Actinospica durhamensis]|uniref:Uncharacterized protein n=1 Tax=Actinospica durhamensis TaxID=1508375 RepID=A0A941EWM7_9ACTN|nr:hypothetical protein [Actinospica durhamensis]MBR7837768.1 hypothetical protein [Actinospica durhamensis]
MNRVHRDIQEHARGAARARIGRRIVGDTLRQLRLWTAVLAALAVALGGVFALALGRDSAGFSGLQARTAEVSATGDLYYELNDMDAQAANALLVGFHPADPSMVPAAVNAAASTSAYGSDRSKADADLALIARNPQLTGQAEHLIDDLGGYEALIAQALYVDQNTADEQPAAPPAAALDAYTRASSMLHTALLPLSLGITDADSATVDGSYAGEHSAAVGFGYAVLALALVSALALYLGNRYHARRFRRRISALAGALVVSLVLGGLGLTVQLGAAAHLHEAKQEAYDSINALTRARAVSDDANADESRWLLEGRSAALQASFFQKIGTVAGVSGVSAEDAGADPHAYYSGLSGAVGELRLDAAADSVSHVTIDGYLGTELNNITFPGEATAAYSAARAFDSYVQDDATIRADAASGNAAGAVAFDIGVQPGASNYAFNQYMTELGTVIQINQAAFTAGIAAGESGIGVPTWVLLIVGELLMLLLITEAARVRLREYH